MIKTPFLAVDGIVEIPNKGLVLIERKNPPKGIAIPGGFVEIGETVEQAVVREIKEETNLNIEPLKIQGVYSDPKRDPRFHTVSIVFICKYISGNPKAQDDAKSLIITPLNKISWNKLVFDHRKILQDYINITTHK